MIVLLLVAAAILFAAVVTWIAWEATHPPRRTAGWALAFGLPVDPAECGMTFESWWFERPGSVRLPVWDIPLDAAADRPTLVVVHGWGRSRIDSLMRLRALLTLAPGRFRRAILVDLRGHGESEPATRRGGSRLGDGEDGDLLELLRRLAPDRCMLMGHSMGAVVSIGAGAMSARTAPVETNRTIGEISKISEISEIHVIGVIAVAPYVEVAVPMIARLRAREAPARPFAEVALVALRLISGIRRRSTVETARLLSVPLAVVAGTEDPLAPLAGAEAIAAAHAEAVATRSPIPQTLVLRLPGVGHAAGLESLDDTGKNALRAFIDSCAGGSAGA